MICAFSVVLFALFFFLKGDFVCHSQSIVPAAPSSCMHFTTRIACLSLPSRWLAVLCRAMAWSDRFITGVETNRIEYLLDCVVLNKTPIVGDQIYIIILHVWIQTHLLIYVLYITKLYWLRRLPHWFVFNIIIIVYVFEQSITYGRQAGYL